MTGTGKWPRGSYTLGSRQSYPRTPHSWPERLSPSTHVDSQQSLSLAIQGGTGDKRGHMLPWSKEGVTTQRGEEQLLVHPTLFAVATGQVSFVSLGGCQGCSQPDQTWALRLARLRGTNALSLVTTGSPMSPRSFPHPLFLLGTSNMCCENQIMEGFEGWLGSGGRQHVTPRHRLDRSSDFHACPRAVPMSSKMPPFQAA